MAQLGDIVKEYVALIYTVIMIICVFLTVGIFLLEARQQSILPYGMRCENCGGVMHLVSGIWVCESCESKYDQEGKLKY